MRKLSQGRGGAAGEPRARAALISRDKQVRNSVCCHGPAGSPGPALRSTFLQARAWTLPHAGSLSRGWELMASAQEERYFPPQCCRWSSKQQPRQGTSTSSEPEADRSGCPRRRGLGSDFPSSAPSSHSRQSQQPSRWWEECWAHGVLQGWRSHLLIRLFGISRPPHAGCLPLDGVCWDSWEKQPQSAPAAPAAAQSTKWATSATVGPCSPEPPPHPSREKLIKLFVVAFASGEDKAAPRQSRVCELGAVRESGWRLPVPCTITLPLCCCALSCGRAESRGWQRLVHGAPETLRKDLGFQNKMLPPPEPQHSHYNSTISVSQNLAILMTKYCDATKYF